jgi:large subunit ribosomal protein L34
MRIVSLILKGYKRLALRGITSFTYNPKKKKRAKTHGFLVRSKSKNGKNVLLRRRRKGRKKLSVSK